MASNITHSTTNIDHCVKRWTPPATLQQKQQQQKQHDVVLAGKNHNNAPVAAFAVTPQRDNTPENDTEIERVKCINRSHKNLRDEDLDEIIKEMETSAVLMELNLNRNQITLADGKFTAALASNTSLQKINLHGNTIGDEGVRSLASALKLNSTLESIILNGNQISKDGAQFLAEALMINKMLRYLNVHGNNIGDEGAQSLAKALKVNNSLVSIDLNQNQISTVGANFLAEALMVNKILENLYMNINNIGDEGVQSLSSALKLNNTLESIILSGNRISKDGAQFMAEALMVNKRLVSINLHSNNIGDKGAESLATALQVNNAMRSVILSSNQISKVGVKFLAKALMVNTSLLSINLSNNFIDDEGALCLAESFTVNRSLRNIQLRSNRITDIGATQLADAIEFNCDCGVSTINLNGNQVSAGLLDMIESICKAKQSSKGKELSSSTTLVQQSTFPATLHHDDVLAGEQHDAPDVVTPSQRDNTPENESDHRRVECITRSNKALQDGDLDEIIKEINTSTVLREIKLSNNLITLADGRFTSALASNTSIRKISLQSNRIGDEGVQSLCAALKINNTLRSIILNGNQISKVGTQFLADALMLNNTLNFINLNCNQISKVGAKFLAEALMVNASLLSINLSSNKIDDEGALCLAESFTVNRSLRCVQLCNNRITDIGATQLADAIEFNRDCGVSTINLNGNQVSAGLLDRIKSICKAKDSSKGNELSSTTIIQTAAQSSRKRKRKARASKDDQIASLKEHIARREKNIAHLNDILRHAKPIVETIDLTTNEAEHATKRTRTESNVKSTLAIMYEQNQKIVHIKKEKMDTEIVLESIRGEKNVVEADLKEVKEDLEDANELVGQMSLTTDIWQGRFDELVALVESGNADGASINAIRNRPLASGK